MANFKPGATVRLKSGGPLMTVEHLGNNEAGEERVWCRWFDDKKQLQTADFRPDLLEEVVRTPSFGPIVVNPRRPPY